MKYFKSPTGEVFAYESDGSQDAWIKPDLVPMTQAEIEAHLNPPAPEPELPQPKTIFAPREYLKRFTMDEYAAARTGPIAVQYALDNLIGAQFVDVNDPDVSAGLDVMVSAGIIDATRKAALLQPDLV